MATEPAQPDALAELLNYQSEREFRNFLQSRNMDKLLFAKKAIIFQNWKINLKNLTLDSLTIFKTRKVLPPSFLKQENLDDLSTRMLWFDVEKLMLKLQRDIEMLNSAALDFQGLYEKWTQAYVTSAIRNSVDNHIEAEVLQYETDATTSLNEWRLYKNAKNSIQLEGNFKTANEFAAAFKESTNQAPSPHNLSAPSSKVLSFEEFCKQSKPLTSSFLVPRHGPNENRKTQNVTVRNKSDNSYARNNSRANRNNSNKRSKNYQRPRYQQARPENRRNRPDRNRLVSKKRAQHAGKRYRN